MRKKVIIFIGISLFFVLLIILSLKGSFPPSFSIGNPSAKDILEGNPDVDILMLDGLIYSEATNLEWFKESNYTKGSLIGEIKKQTFNPFWYQNFYATNLPEGSKIYSVSEKEYSKGDAPSIIIVEHNNEILIYHSLVEG
ncbi:hypothetical protein [Ornithinibacillus sp. 179-J 7C1 HS]|uniref:hypothetical protein n=1 Tax=Ornithinibacillus sp. 179-J 7C1 HS TaxID=3142384 RepID=UPI0039A2C3CE